MKEGEKRCCYLVNRSDDLCEVTTYVHLYGQIQNISQISHCFPLLQKFSPCKTQCFLPSLSFSPHYRREWLREKKQGDEMAGCGGVSMPVSTCLCKTSVGKVRFVIVNIIAIKQPKPGIHKNLKNVHQQSKNEDLKERALLT